MNYTRSFLTTFMFFHFFVAIGQFNPKLDTIQLINLYSNIPTISTTQNLTLCLGIPASMSFNRCTPVYDAFYRIDTNYCFNSINYFEKGISYLEKDGRIRLKAIDFKKSPTVFISTDKVILSRELTLEELKKVYHYTDADISEPQIGSLAPWYPNKKKDCFYQVNFSTGEHDMVYIELYFDCTQRLRFVSIGAYDF